LLALDYDEAEDIVETLRRERQASVVDIYDGLFLPALSYAKADQRRGHLSERQEKFVFATIGALQEEMAGDMLAERSSAPASQRITIVGIPAEGDTDERALLLLSDLLDPQHCIFEIIVAESEAATKLRENMPAALVIAALAPGGVAQTRHLCRRLRAKAPDLNVIVLRSAPTEGPTAQRESFIAAGADVVAYSLNEARARLEEIARVFDARQSADPAPSRIPYVKLELKEPRAKDAEPRTRVLSGE